MRDLAHTTRFIPRRKENNTGTKIKPYRKSKISQHGIACCVSGWCTINHQPATFDIVRFKSTNLLWVHQWEQKWQIRRASPIEIYWNDDSWNSPFLAIDYKPFFRLHELEYWTPWDMCAENVMVDLPNKAVYISSISRVMSLITPSSEANAQFPT
jgi:hypothetical protein